MSAEVAGFKTGLWLSSTTAVDRVDISAGKIHITDGSTHKVVTLPSGVQAGPFSLISDTFYYVYVYPPLSGNTISVSNFVIGTATPVLNETRRGWYHPSQVYRCIGAFKTHPVYDDEILSFRQNGVISQYINTNYDDFSETLTETDATSWTGATLPIPIFADSAIAWCYLGRVTSSAYFEIRSRPSGLDGPGVSACSLGSSDNIETVVKTLHTNENQDLQIRVSSDINNAQAVVQLRVQGWELPQWIGDTP